MIVPTINDEQSMSDTLYIRGLSRRVTDEELLGQILNYIEDPVETDLLSKRASGVIWARYSSMNTAQRTIMKIHQSVWHGVSLNARFELGFDSSGARVTAASCHNTVIRSVNFRKGYTPAKHDKRSMKDIIQSAQHSASYSSKSLSLGNFEYPFPTGLYLTRVIQLTRTLSSSDALLKMITDPCLGNKYGKELSEVMAMVDATDRAVKLTVGEQPSALSEVTVYALGDGKRPLSAAALCLHMPSSWKYVSIDPLLEVDKVELGQYHDRFTLFQGLSQDFDLSSSDSSCAQVARSGRSSRTLPLAIVIALHSHAPLKDFWTRLKGKKVAVTMECCAEYSELQSVGEKPLLEFDDFEVYSPKRTVKIYASCDLLTRSVPPLPPDGDTSRALLDDERSNLKRLSSSMQEDVTKLSTEISKKIR